MMTRSEVALGAGSAGSAGSLPHPLGKPQVALANIAKINFVEPKTISDRYVIDSTLIFGHCNVLDFPSRSGKLPALPALPALLGGYRGQGHRAAYGHRQATPPHPSIHPHQFWRWPKAGATGKDVSHE
jgi:hypothetical protein